MKAIGNLFGGGGQTVIAPPPALAPPPPMPTPDDQAVKDAKRRALSSLTQRKMNRDSTILSSDVSTASDKLG